MSVRDRLSLDGYLAAFGASKDGRLVDLASRCRMALNVRAIALGRASDPEEVAFMPEEIAFVRSQVSATRDAMSALLGSLS
jgi:hypothetical protein